MRQHLASICNKYDVKGFSKSCHPDKQMPNFKEVGCFF